MTGPFTDADGRRHSPTPGVEHWQESFLTSWYDPATRSGGYHHIDLQPGRGRACLWSWTAVGGRVAGRYQSLNLPLPDADLTDLTVGSWRLRTHEPLAAWAVAVRHPGTGAGEDVELTAISGPLHHHMVETGSTTSEEHRGPSDYSSTGTGHYETVARVTGTVTDTDGTTTAVRGWGFQDHSWGPRQYGRLNGAHRWVQMTFGDDLYGSLYAIEGDDVSYRYGYLIVDGAVHRADRLDVEVTIATDGHTPLRCTGVVHDQAGRAFAFDGETAVSSVSSHDGGFFATDGLGEFRLGDRVGSGLLSVSERSAPSARHRAWLNAFDDGPSA